MKQKSGPSKAPAEQVLPAAGSPGSGCVFLTMSGTPLRGQIEHFRVPVRTASARGETGKNGWSVSLRVRCPPTAFPTAIRLERRRRHVPSRKAALKKITGVQKTSILARMSHKQSCQNQWPNRFYNG
jgi:hypothetical protein